MLNGLLMKSKAPSRTDSMAVSSVPNPLIKITGDDGETLRKCLSSAMPFRRSFKLMSLTIRSNFSACAAACAAPAFKAALTAQPWSSKISRRKLQVSASSSITKIFLDKVVISLQIEVGTQGNYPLSTMNYQLFLEARISLEKQLIVHS